VFTEFPEFWMKGKSIESIARAVGLASSIHSFSTIKHPPFDRESTSIHLSETTASTRGARCSAYHPSSWPSYSPSYPVSLLLLSTNSVLTYPLLAQVSTIYWPINYPNATSPWLIGSKNYVSWQTGGGTGIQSFDIQLHNSNRSLLVGFIPIALRVPMTRLTTGRKNYGGELEVDLSTGVPTG